MLRNRPAFRLLAGLLFAASAGIGQSTFASLTGVVSDSTGGVVPKAQVSATNTRTGVVRETTSNTAGVFNLPNLDVGPYVLRVTSSGFNTFERSGLNLVSNQVLNINVELALGSTSSVVEVKGTSPTITTETNDLSGTMGAKAVQDLPLVSRHTGDGGVFAYTTLNTGAAAVGGSVIPAFGGTRVQTGSQPTMDGIAVMSYPFGANPVQPSLESVQEITVVKASGPAEFATAANIKVVSKSGSNEFHGGAFWAYNGNSLNSRTFFASSVPFRVYNNFGASMGGPVIRNKLFFFGTYEGSRESAKVITYMDTPLPAWRGGDFSSLLGKVTLKNPFTGQVFPNNQIPSSLISSVSQKAQDYYYPQPNTGAPGQLSSNWQAQYRGTTGFTIFDHFDLRGDYNITSKDSVFARISWRRMPLEYTDVYPLHVTQLRRSKSGVASWTHIVSPAAVNEFRFGATFHVNPYYADVVGSDLVQQFGLQGTSVTGIHNAPGFNITGVSSADLDAAGDNYHNNPSTSYQWTDSLSWTRGSHLMKFGVDVIREQLNGGNIASNVYGSFNYSGIYSGLGYADFLLGIPQTSSLSVPNPPRDFRGTTLGLYAQDQFKVNRSLTLNYGIRWELPMPYTSKHGAMYNFNPATGTLVVPDNGISKLNPFYPKNLTTVSASQAGFPADALIDFHKTSIANIQPRVGFAYKLFGSDKSVIRGGYGIYSSLIYSTLAAQNMLGGPFSGSVTYTNAITNGVPLFSMPNPFLPSGTTSVQNVTGANPRLKLPYTQQWNLTVEQQVGDYGIRVSYLGARTSQLVYRRNLNTPAPSLTPFTNARKAYPNFNQVIYSDSGGTEFYGALEASVERRFGQNLTFNTGYTWSKDLTDTQEASPFAGQVIQNPYDRAAEKANSNYSLPQRWYGYALYRLPFGQGQLLFPNAGKVLNAILGGWDTSWTAVAQSGQFFNPTFSGFDPSNTNTLGGRPDRIGDGKLTTGRNINRWFDASAFAIPGCPSTTPVCSSPAPVGRFGNAGINILHGPNVYNLDFGMIKSFHVTERARVQFRMTAANALNHPNFAVPRSNISALSTVGTIAGQVKAIGGAPIFREVDFGLRLEF